MAREENPMKLLEQIASKEGVKVHSREFAKLMDERDQLKSLREDFIFPKSKRGSKKNAIYLAANERGLTAKQAKSIVVEVMDSWAKTAVECHMQGPLPAAFCENEIVDQMSAMIGAKENEVAVFNDSHTNLHLLLVSFYRPDRTKHKILVVEESGILDIAKSHIKKHQGDTTKSLLVVRAAERKLLESDDILRLIESEGHSICTVILPAILPISGRVLDIEAITSAGHEKDCTVGFVLSDAVGNIELDLHRWRVDFACWDTGRFLGAGPCAIGGAFLHSKHAQNEYPILTGWWGHRMSSRFEMSNNLERSPGIDGYKISNEPPIKIAQLKAVLDVYDKTTMGSIREKSVLLSGFLELSLHWHLTEASELKSKIVILSPNDASKRGAQINLQLCADAKKVCETLSDRGIICSHLASDILTACTAPLFCSFEDVFEFSQALVDIMQEIK